MRYEGYLLLDGVYLALCLTYQNFATSKLNRKATVDVCLVCLYPLVSECGVIRYQIQGGCTYRRGLLRCSFRLSGHAKALIRGTSNGTVSHVIFFIIKS